MHLNWDNSRIDDAAKALMVINPGGNNSAEGLAAYIRSAAERTLSQHIADGTAPSYVGTGGWYVTFYQGAGADRDEWKALVTIMPYAVNHWLEEALRPVLEQVRDHIVGSTGALPGSDSAEQVEIINSILGAYQ
jgi:hypothetical protein